jgi:hypothetical protein
LSTAYLDFIEVSSSSEPFQQVSRGCLCVVSLQPAKAQRIRESSFANVRRARPMRSTTRVAKRKNNLLHSSPFVLVCWPTGVQPFARNARAGDTPVRHSCCWERRHVYTTSRSTIAAEPERDILKTRLAIAANYTLSTLSFARPHVAAFAYVRRTHTLMRAPWRRFHNQKCDTHINT